MVLKRIPDELVQRRKPHTKRFRQRSYYADESGEIYSVSHFGEIKKLKQRVQTSRKRTDRYYLYARTPLGWKPVHRLVCAAWHGLPQEGDQVRHQDRDVKNNRPSNLLWGTAFQNNCVDRAGEFKLDSAKVQEMRSLMMQGLGFPELAKRYGVSYGSVYYISVGKTWRHCMDDEFREWVRKRL